MGNKRMIASIWLQKKGVTWEEGASEIIQNLNRLSPPNTLGGLEVLGGWETKKKERNFENHEKCLKQTKISKCNLQITAATNSHDSGHKALNSRSLLKTTKTNGF